jgi:hypothetical protein
MYVWCLNYCHEVHFSNLVYILWIYFVIQACWHCQWYLLSLLVLTICWIIKDRKYRNILSFNNQAGPFNSLIKMATRPFSFWIMSKHSSRASLLIYTEFKTLLWTFHHVSIHFGAVWPQTVLNKSKCFGEVGEKDKNPHMLTKDSFTDFTVEHAHFITKFSWWA